MRRGLLTASLLLVLIGTGTAWLFVRVEYGNLENLRKDMDRRFSPGQEVPITARIERLRREKIPAIQQALQLQKLDGWLLYDYQGSDLLARGLLGLAPQDPPMRRWFYFIPAAGTPQKVVHRTESSVLDRFPGGTRIYTNWQQMQAELKLLLHGTHSVAMQYSPGDQVPILSRVSAGTVELVREFGVDVVSSADLLQSVEARWTDTQLGFHRRAAKLLYDEIQLGFAEVRAALEANERMTEGRLQRFLQQQAERAGLKNFGVPLVASGIHSTDPNYAIASGDGGVIQPGDVLVLRLRGHVDEPDAVFAEVTWTGFVGRDIPEDVERYFKVVVAARDAALRAIQEASRARSRILGWEVDAEARKVVAMHGLGDLFPHRTGHSLGRDIYGLGANLDSLESQDVRPLIPGTAFTIEPGIYSGQVGVRTGINVYLGVDGPEVTTQPVQDRVVLILR